VDAGCARAGAVQRGKYGEHRLVGPRHHDAHGARRARRVREIRRDQHDRGVRAREFGRVPNVRVEGERVGLRPRERGHAGDQPVGICPGRERATRETRDRRGGEPARPGVAAARGVVGHRRRQRCGGAGEPRRPAPRRRAGGRRGRRPRRGGRRCGRAGGARGGDRPHARRDLGRDVERAVGGEHRRVGARREDHREAARRPHVLDGLRTTPSKRFASSCSRRCPRSCSACRPLRRTPVAALRSVSRSGAGCRA
jgi:hypothetical protein